MVLILVILVAVVMVVLHFVMVLLVKMSTWLPRLGKRKFGLLGTPGESSW